jgi:hypothetical protein
VPYTKVPGEANRRVGAGRGRWAARLGTGGQNSWERDESGTSGTGREVARDPVSGRQDVHGKLAKRIFALLSCTLWRRVPRRELAQDELAGLVQPDERG